MPEQEAPATLADVLDGLPISVEQSKFVSSVFGNMMTNEVAAYFANGKARIPMPSTETMSYPQQSIIHAFWSLCLEWSEPGFKRQRQLTRYEKYQGIGAPSAFGKPSGWTKWQNAGNGLGADLQIMCLRPAECSWINIRIMHPVFHEIIEILDSGDPQSHDFLFAAELNALMPEAYLIENSRRDAITAIFNKYVPDSASTAIGVQCIADKFDTDGTCKQAGTNIEYKNEKGKGDSDPYMQNIGYFLQYWGNDNSGPRRHCCPWMLVEVLGQEIGISGAVWACDYPCVQPLSCNVPFLPVPADNQARLKQARICMAIRHGFTTLKTFYSNVPTTENSQAGFPYVRNCNIQGHEVTLKYLRPMYPEVRKMLFVAQVGSDENFRVLVKFTDRYNEHAHNLAANADLAPKLHCVKQVAGLQMVVMELLENYRHWGVAVEKESELVRKQLHQFLDVFAQANLVHGDLRPPNILLKDSKLKVVDFDWTGTHGVDKYPIVVNPKETWAKGVQAACTMFKEHDQYMVSKLLADGD